jgi:hypothetical protein
MGVIEDKVIKNHFASRVHTTTSTRTTRPAGVISTDDNFGTITIAEPIGIILRHRADHHPTSTAIFQGADRAEGHATPSSSARIRGPAVDQRAAARWCFEAGGLRRGARGTSSAGSTSRRSNSLRTNLNARTRT